jgi:transposase
VCEISGLDASLAYIAARITAALDDCGSRLVEVDRIGPVLGVRLIGRTGRASRFPGADAFAIYAVAAPIVVSSGEHNGHRFSHSGDRQLTSPLHLVAITQVRMAGSIGRRYFDRKIAEGKTRERGHPLPQTPHRCARLAPTLLRGDSSDQAR